MLHPTILRIAEDREQSNKFLPPPRKYTKDTFVDEDVYNDLIVAKSQLLKEFPFWGILGMTIKLVEMPSDQLPTLATDGYHVFYSAEFCKSLTKGERVFALAHELFHGLYEHAGKTSRMEAYTGVNLRKLLAEDAPAAEIKAAEATAKLWNFAADFVVNTGLVEAHVGEFIKTIPILYDDKYIGWAVEEVYEDLLENPDQIPEGAQCLDQHIEIEVVPDDYEGDMDAESDGQGNAKIKMKASDFEKMRKDWQENMVSAAAAQKEHEQRETNAAGCIPSAVQRLIDELAKPKVNWRAALRRAVQRVIHRRYSYKTPHRGHFQRGMTIPGFRDATNKLDIAVFVDTSGSVQEEQLTVFLSELQGMLGAFPRYKVHMHCFDGAVCEGSVLMVEKSHGASGWETAKTHVLSFIGRVQGGGGTNFECNWDYLKEHKIKPRMIIMLTDGYPCGGWGDAKYAPTVFFMMGNGRQVTAPFGMSLHYEDYM